MLSRGEIKKAGFKPVENPEARFKSYERKAMDGRPVVLRHINEEFGEVVIAIVHGDEGPGNTRWESTLFSGKIPSRYELLIIMRCCGIA